MADIRKDIGILEDIFNGEAPYRDWTKIYPRTTENIAKVLDIVDVRGLDVYSVLSSSDIPFSLIEKRVKSIDTFDINPLTLRYYYLRKWMLENGLLDGKDLEYDVIQGIINQKRIYINDDEKTSVKFWNIYIEKMNKYFFNLYNACLFNYVSERIACCYDDDLSYLVEHLSSHPLAFECRGLSLSGEQNKKYDLVYLSNIMDLNDKYRVGMIAQTLESLLNTGGQVICTNLVKHPYFDFFREQREVFKEKFAYEELFRERVGSEDNVYYRYIKK